MKKNIELKIMLESLDKVREQFYDYGSEIIEKISRYHETGTMSGYAGDPSFDYAEFSKVMKGGFHSLTLQLIFESLIYLHYFSEVYEVSLDPKEFIHRRKFDHKAFEEKTKRYVDLTIHLDILKIYVKRGMRNLGIYYESCIEILNSGKNIFEILKALKHAMYISLHHYGCREFLVSKIPISEEHPFDTELVLNTHIFYTDKPEQIIAFANRAKPGVYIIANVPYGNHAETAFYVLFRQKGYAYLVENSKHSFRDQYYRNKSNGTVGKDAWLDRKYETCYLPVEIVMNFFAGETTSKAVNIFEESVFTSIGELTKCSPHTVLYTYAFVDNCITFFKDQEFASKISNTSCAGFVDQLLKGSTENVPAIAASLLPALGALDISWSPDKAGVDDVSDTLKGVEAELPMVQATDLSGLSQGSLTSIEHLRRSIIFRNRLNRAEALQEMWLEDFKKNHNNVSEELASFITNKGLKFLAQKSLKNLTYPLRVYRQFGTVSKANEQGYIDTTILNSIDKKVKNEHGSYLNTFRLTGYTQLHQHYYSSDDRSFSYPSSTIKGYKHLCCYCDDAIARHFYTLQFLDWDIFRAFFEIKEEELSLIPDQIKKYLNLSSTQYFGNSILDDIDPIALIKNPWFVAVMDRLGDIQFNQRNVPAYYVNFRLCGNCLRELQKG
jgi:hypothetical protein